MFIPQSTIVLGNTQKPECLTHPIHQVQFVKIITSMCLQRDLEVITENIKSDLIQVSVSTFAVKVVTVEICSFSSSS